MQRPSTIPRTPARPPNPIPDPSQASEIRGDPRHPFKAIFCEHCGFVHRFKISCGRRTCPVCRRKWFGYHFKPLFEVVDEWEIVHSLTLTTRNIPDGEFGRYHVKQIRDWFSQLRRRFRREISGGFYVVQATNRGKGWHLHLHIIFEGKYIPQKVISNAWEKITGGSYIVDVKDVKDARKAIRYLLADFSGAPRIRPDDCEVYDSVFKGSRLVQPFGKFRTMKFKRPFKCPVCGNDTWVDIDILLGVHTYYKCRDRDGP